MRAARFSAPRRCVDSASTPRQAQTVESWSSSRPSSTASPAAAYAVRHWPRSKSADASSRSACGKRANAPARRAASMVRRASRAASSWCPRMNRPRPTQKGCSGDSSRTPPSRPRRARARADHVRPRFRRPRSPRGALGRRQARGTGRPPSPALELRRGAAGERPADLHPGTDRICEQLGRTRRIGDFQEPCRL